METFGNRTQINEVAAKLGGTVTADVKFYPYKFMQMLAKIAHGMAWEQVGPENFTPFLCDLVRGIDRDAAYFVGETTKQIEDGFLPKDFYNKDHAFIGSLIEWDGEYLVTYRVRLFSRFNVPTYFIVVGRLTPTDQWLSRYGLAREGRKIIRAPR